MELIQYFRGGPRLLARPDEVKIDRATNTLKNLRGVSVYDTPRHRNLTAYGGAYLVTNMPDRLKVIQTGRDSSHHEIVPAETLSMTFSESQGLLDQIVLTPVDLSGQGE